MSALATAPQSTVPAPSAADELVALRLWQATARYHLAYLWETRDRYAAPSSETRQEMAMLLGIEAPADRNAWVRCDRCGVPTWETLDVASLYCADCSMLGAPCATLAEVA